MLLGSYSLAFVKSVAIILFSSARDRAEAARRAHNPEVVGSNPTPATQTPSVSVGFFDPQKSAIRTIILCHNSHFFHAVDNTL